MYESDLHLPKGLLLLLYLILKCYNLTLSSFDNVHHFLIHVDCTCEGSPGTGSAAVSMTRSVTWLDTSRTAVALVYPWVQSTIKRLTEKQAQYPLQLPSFCSCFSDKLRLREQRRHTGSLVVYSMGQSQIASAEGSRSSFGSWAWWGNWGSPQRVDSESGHWLTAAAHARKRSFSTPTACVKQVKLERPLRFRGCSGHTCFRAHWLSCIGTGLHTSEGLHPDEQHEWHLNKTVLYNCKRILS